jgi:hypothetical protein
MIMLCGFKACQLPEMGKSKMVQDRLALSKADIETTKRL